MSNFLPSGKASFSYADGGLRHRTVLAMREVQQFAHHWRNTLLTCNSRSQYDEQHRRFMAQVKMDPSLHASARAVLKDVQLLQWRNALPATSQQKRYASANIETDDPRYTCSTMGESMAAAAAAAAAENPTEDVTYRDCCGNEIVLRVAQGTFAAVSPCGNIVVYYESRTSIAMLKDGHRQGTIPCDPNNTGLLSCAQSPNGTMVAVCNERSVYLPTHGLRHHIENGFLTAMTLTNDVLVMGTARGQIYAVDPQSGQLLQYDKLPNALAVLQLHRRDGTTLAQTIQGLTIVEESEMIELPVLRPLCCGFTSAGDVVSLGKYGHLQRHTNDKASRKLEIVPFLPWYDGVLSTTDEMVLPNQQITSICIDQASE